MRHSLVIGTLMLALVTVVAPANAEIIARVKVGPGDTLGAIARRYDCSVGAVKQQNRLRSTRIDIGSLKSNTWSIWLGVLLTLATAPEVRSTPLNGRALRLARTFMVNA